MDGALRKQQRQNLLETTCVALMSLSLLRVVSLSADSSLVEKMDAA